MTKEINTSRRPREPALKPLTAEPDVDTSAPALPVIKPQTKAALVEGLLLQDTGTALVDLCKATGWLPHTCRAFLTGLRKKGLELERTKREDGVTIYKLTAVGITA